MKIPTHIYFFDSQLSDDQFQIAKLRTANKDFEKLLPEQYPTLFSIFELMCEENWIGEYEHIYAIFTKEDCAALKYTNLVPIIVLEYNEKLRAIIDEAYALYSFNENLVDSVSTALAIMDEYSDIKVKNFDYKRQIDGDYFAQIYDFIESEKRQILNALDEQLDELNLA